MTDVRFCKVQFEKPPLAPERRPREGPYSPPGAALGAGRSKIPTSRASRALLARPGAVRRGAAGRRQGPSRTASDSRRP